MVGYSKEVACRQTEKATLCRYIQPPECKEKYQIKIEIISFETAANFKYLVAVTDQNLIREEIMSTRQ
jgi:hypothetical protein